MFIFFVNILVLGAVDVAMGTGPFSLGGFVQFWIQAAEMVSTRAGVAEDNLATLLADLAVFLRVKIRI